MSSLSLTLIFASLVLPWAAKAAEQETTVCPDGVCPSAASGVDVQSLLVLASSTVKLASELESQQMMKMKQQSLQLSKQFVLAAKAMPQGSATQSLLESYKVCGQCNSFQRFGEANDGGYLMCMDGLKKGSVNAAFSLGVEHHDQWSQDVVNNMGIAVNQFDCTVEGSDCQGCKFFKKCIVAADGQHPVPSHETEGWSLTQALTETSQENAPDGSLLMKMDIESSEWPIYAAEPPSALKKFGELIVEFHNLQDETRHPEYLQAMQHILAAGFKVAHLHGNNYGGMYETGKDAAGKDTNIPMVVEVTFIQGAARPDGCGADQDYNKLDAPNNPSNAELPIAHMR